MYFSIKCIGKLPGPTNEFERSLVFETGEFERPKFDCITLPKPEAGFFNTIQVSNSLDPDQAKPDILSGLIWVQIVCKGFQQKTNVTLADKELNTKQFVDTTFWLKPWLKLISLVQTFFHLAKVLATTNSEPG